MFNQLPVCFSFGNCFDHSYCLGKISSPVLPIAAAISSSLPCILNAGIGCFVNKNKCTPPDLVIQGTNGSDISLMVARMFSVFIGYSSTSMQPHLQVSSSFKGTTPIDFFPVKCCSQRSRVRGSCNVRPLPSLLIPLAVFFCPVISYTPCALSKPENTSMNFFAVSSIVT